MTQRVFGIAGWKNSGKTTLTERLVASLSGRGWQIATVKRAHHVFDLDQPGTDSFRHRSAGAIETAIVSSRRYAVLHELRDEAEPTLADVLARLSPCDLVLVEGYKNASHPKIECRRSAARDQTPLAGLVPHVVAIAGDQVGENGNLPHFMLDDIEAIADFVIRYCGLPPTK